MCGIIAYIGPRDAAPLLLAGLKQLEYRGYDSAGIAVIQNGRIETRKAAGKLAALHALVSNQPLHGAPGIGHTRWATHGAATAANAHPHAGAQARVAVVHNGIVENWQELQRELATQGVRFVSDTDTETIAQLLERLRADGLGFLAAAQATCRRLRGASVVVLMALDEPDKLVVARLGNAGGLVVGLGNGENFVASDASALLQHTRRMLFLEAGQMAVVTAGAASVTTLDGAELAAQAVNVDWSAQAAEKGDYRHFMHKELHEQPQALRATLAGRIAAAAGKVQVPELALTPVAAQRIRRILITGCGSALHAGMAGKILIEHLAGIPVDVACASELRHAEPVLHEGTVVLAISQSGETVDTLGAMEEARRRHATLWSIVNAPGSQALRIADGHIAMRCGPELGVASTKAFTTSVLDLYLLALVLADLRGTLDAGRRRALLDDAEAIPGLVARTLAREAAAQQLARALQPARSCLYIGRGPSLPVALEGALKLKELAYVHAEACAAGELKHGPLALVDAALPVICVVPRDRWRTKVLAQMQQVRARQGSLVALATDGDEEAAALADQVLYVPDVPWLLSPLVTVLPLQQLAYHSALLRGLDVDQPRHLAKSVTVE